MKKVFISYSHKDEKWKNRLVEHLGVLKQENLLEVWDDRRIGAGDDWYSEIEQAIVSSDVAVLLVTASFLNSKFILGTEIPRLLDRRLSEGVRVIPLIVKPCAWRKVKWLKSIQARPKSSRALSAMRSYTVDKALADLATEIIDVSNKVFELKQKNDLPTDSLDLDEVSEKSSEKTALADEVNVEVKINMDFDNFADREQKEILNAIGRILRISGAIAVVGKEKGCVRLTIRLLKEKAEELVRIAQSGELKELWITGVNIVRQTSDRIITDERSPNHDVIEQIDKQLHSLKQLLRSKKLMTPKIVFFATAWGTRYGGINSFNYDLCCALAPLISTKYEIVCVVPRADESQVEEAKKQGVKLVALRYVGAEECFLDEDVEQTKKLFSPLKNNQVWWWIGHDVKTGPIAIKAARETGMGRVALFHHMGYESYLALMPIDTQEPIYEQRHILNQGDIIFAIGPKLARSAKDIVQDSDKSIEVKELFPGLHNIRVKNAPKIFSAIVFGRLSAYTNCVKQSTLAVAAFGHACSLKFSPLAEESKLMVIGLPGGEQGRTEREQLKAIAAKHAQRIVQIHPWPYFEDREKLFKELRLKSVCIVPSVYEGFGLVGLEAISAEVPLIVSKNSGLYEFIDEQFSEMVGCVNSVDIRGQLVGDYSEHDVKQISMKILEVGNDIEKAKKKAKRLKALMQSICTWENCATAFAGSLGIPTVVDPDRELCSEDVENEICRLCNFSEAQLDEMFDSIKAFYGF